MFTMTTVAAQRIREAARESSAEGMALRVAARRDADGSIQYGMGFDDVHEGESPVLLSDDVPVLIGTSSQVLLAGTVLDFVELEPGDFRFIFVPPDAMPSTDCASGAASSGGGCGSGRCGTAGCGSAQA